jgi:lambda family phage tail tape measure protein
MALALAVDLTANVARLQQDMHKATGILQRFGNAAKSVGAAIASYATIGTAREFMDLGARAMQAETAFRHTAEAVKVSATEWEHALKKATNSTVDSSDLMRAAMKQVTGGLKWEDTVALGEIARTAARRTGEDVATAYTNIGDAVETMRTRALRAYGLITKDQAKWIEAIKASGEAVDVMSVILTNAAAQTEIMGGVVTDARERAQQFHATIKDLKEEIGTHLVNAFADALEAAKKWWKGMGEIKKEGFWDWYKRKREETADMLTMSDAGYMPGPTYTTTVSEEKRKAQKDMNKDLEERAARARGHYEDIAKQMENFRREIAAMNPALTEQDKIMQRIQDKWDDIQKNAVKLKVPLTKEQMAQGAQAIADAENFMRIDEMLKRVHNDLDQFEYHGGFMEGLFGSKEEIDAYVEAMKNLRDHEENLAVNTQNANSELRTQFDVMLGIEKGLQKYLDDSKTTTKQVEDTVVNSFEAMNDAIVEFCMNGKASFTDMANSIIRDILRIAVRQSITGPLAGMAMGALGSLFGGGGQTGVNIGQASMVEGYGMASGGIINRPTFVGAANGMPVIGGEAGAEGVLPLTRLPGGDLGVKSSGGGGGATIINISAVDAQSFGDMCRRNPQAILGPVQDAMRDNTGLRQTMRRTR